MKPLYTIILLLLAMLALSTSPMLAEDNCNSSCTAPTYGLSSDIIAAYPRPTVRQLAANAELLTDRRYDKVKNAIEVFNTPNGSVIDGLAAGFNYVTVTSITGDSWTEINPGQWVRSENLIEVAPSTFAGVLIKEPPKYPIGWMLVNTRPSREPGAKPMDSDLPILRYTVVNLYESVDVDGWLWYQIGVDQWVKQTVIGKSIPVERPTEIDTKRWVSVDLYEQVAIAYEDNTPVFTTLVASGLEDWATEEGLFHVYVRFPRTRMSGAQGKQDFYSLEEVPWTMYFNKDQALHGTYWHDGFGYRHSHGCVNLSITDANWLYTWAAPEFDFTVSNDLGPAVYVYSSGEYK